MRPLRVEPRTGGKKLPERVRAKSKRSKQGGVTSQIASDKEAVTPRRVEDDLRTCCGSGFRAVGPHATVQETAIHIVAVLATVFPT
jgi:hypothetical protein